MLLYVSAAAERERMQVVRFLLDEGADINFRPGSD
jgi:hypothetical protein